MASPPVPQTRVSSVAGVPGLREEVSGLVPASTGCHTLENPGASARGQNPDQRKIPQQGSQGGVHGRGKGAKVAPEGHTHRKAQPLMGGGGGGKSNGRGWSWQARRGGRKQETIKEKWNPGLGSAGVMEPCRLSSGGEEEASWGIGGGGRGAVWGGGS